MNTCYSGSFLTGMNPGFFTGSKVEGAINSLIS